MMLVVYYGVLLFLRQKMVLCPETVEKYIFFAAVKLHCKTSENKLFEYQCVLKWWAHHLYNAIGQKNSWNLVLGTEGLFVQRDFFSWIFLKKLFLG